MDIDISKIKVSAIINTHNRYEQFILAVNSVKKQTHENIEIIVVDDNSEDERYHSARPDGIKWIGLDKSSREIFGFPSLGYVRNIGISAAQGEYIALLDDDDVWLPDKIKLQLTTMIKKGFVISCTEGLMGDSMYNPNKKYPIYHAEFYENFCKSFFEKNYGLWNSTLPDIFDLELIQKHNFIIHSSVMLKKSLLDNVGLYKESLPLGGKRIGGEIFFEDWDLWKRCLENTNCLHISRPLIYYDGRLKQRSKIKKSLRFLARKLKTLLFEKKDRSFH